MPEASALAVRKSVIVKAPIEKAFEVFTADIGSWWPRKSHSISGEKTASVSMETRRGGRLFETDSEGTQHDWGVITAWDPPNHLACTWAVRRGAAAQAIEVNFAAEREGTRVDLVHTGWEKLGDEAPELMKSYDTGWDFVLGEYMKGTTA
jgi:uncharacterized protein YndB with AHSA1/START domain